MSGARDSISIAFVRQAAAAVARLGGDPTPLLARAGIAPLLLESDAARVTPESFGSLWLSIAASLDDEFFGLDSRRMKVGSFSALCHLTLGSVSLREALRRMRHFFNILLDDTVVHLESDVAETTMLLVSRCPPDSAGQARMVFAQETLLVMIHGVLCWLAGRRIPICRARFAHPRPDWWPEYELIFCADLGFGAEETRIVLGSRYLDAPVVQTRASIKSFLRGAPANFILKYRDEQSLAARVRRQLRDLAPDDWPTQSDLAKELKLGVSTLHRKLDREGTSFQAIKDAIRRDLAIRLLTVSEMSIGEIAAMAGFAETSAFRRAFKLWTGVPPSALRVVSAQQKPDL